MILFVCTGNTCRSAMAHVMARAVFDREGITEEICSRGTDAFPGMEACAEAKAVVQEYGCSLEGHRAESLSDEDVKHARLILTMTRGHMKSVQDRFLQSDKDREKIYTLKGFLQGVDGDIADPFGGDIEIYRSCAEEIYPYITELAEIVKWRQR